MTLQERAVERLNSKMQSACFVLFVEMLSYVLVMGKCTLATPLHSCINFEHSGCFTIHCGDQHVWQCHVQFTVQNLLDKPYKPFMYRQKADVHWCDKKLKSTFIKLPAVEVLQPAKICIQYMLAIDSADT